MDAHGVQVLDGADDDHVVGQVAHHLQLVLLPAQQTLLYQHLHPTASSRSVGTAVLAWGLQELDAHWLLRTGQSTPLVVWQCQLP